ncbi:MAG: APC family permease [Gammaproteobacteria bacterium]|nr:APC family permease [Gammaproteobacteria bacterium]
MKTDYQAKSLTLTGAVAMGTGVMIGAGIFALTGQIAELAGSGFPWVFVVAALVTGFSAYSYVKLSNAFPSAGGIAMFLEKAYGRTAVTASAGLLMAFSMVINESLVARTFGTYTARLLNGSEPDLLVPALAVMLIVIAFLINISGNRLVGSVSLVMAVAKVAGIGVLALAGFLAAQELDLLAATQAAEPSVSGFIAALALGVLAFKGFTTITNSGSEIVDPHRNVGRAIVLSIVICVVIYLLVALAVNASLSLPEIVAARDYALAEAARPTFGELGVILTILLAIVATASGLIASIFAVSRMLAMLTDMKLIPHRHFGMPGRVQSHTLVYTACIAIVLTVFFDLGRIAALGAILYLVMDIAVHWGVLRYLRDTVGANVLVVGLAIGMDVVVLTGLLMVKLETDALIVAVAGALILLIYIAERVFLGRANPGLQAPHSGHK